MARISLGTSCNFFSKNITFWRQVFNGNNTKNWYHQERIVTVFAGTVCIKKGNNISFLKQFAYLISFVFLKTGFPSFSSPMSNRSEYSSLFLWSTWKSAQRSAFTRFFAYIWNQKDRINQNDPFSVLSFNITPPWGKPQLGCQWSAWICTCCLAGASPRALLKPELAPHSPEKFFPLNQRGGFKSKKFLKRKCTEVRGGWCGEN